MSKYHGNDSEASDPGGVTLERGRLAQWPRPGSVLAALKRKLFGDELVEKLAEHLQRGDSRAAVVVSVAPLVVAAYTDELDCVALLAFPAGFVERFGLEVGTRLLTVNTYQQLDEVVDDLHRGPGDLSNFQNFRPLIAEFLSESTERIAQRKAEIEESEWARCAELAREYVKWMPGVARDGSPFMSVFPAFYKP